jgi:hypothetical protein
MDEDELHYVRFTLIERREDPMQDPALEPNKGPARVLLAVAGVAMLSAAAVGVVLNRTTSRGVHQRGNATVNPPAPIDENNSPTIVRNPRRPENLVTAYRIDRPRFSASLQSSLDGGRTWRAAALPLPAGSDRPYAPDVAFSSDGTLHVLFSNLEGRGNGPGNLWLSTSTDGGRTLAPPTRVTGALAFQARLAVDPKGPLYVTWLQATDTGTLSFVGPDPFVEAVRSIDGGRTFSAPVRVSDPGRRRVGAASAVVDHTGRLVVLYEDFKGDVRDFQFLEGPPYDATFALVVTASDDGGGTFGPGVEIEPGVVPTRRFLVYLPEFPSLAAGPGKTLYASWSDGRAGDDDVYLRRSDDGGRTWAPPVRVNRTRRGDGTSQTLPRVAVAPNGRVDVVFYDRRDDVAHNVMSGVTLATSTDQGRTWRNTPIADQAFDTRIGSSADPLLPVDFGTRLGLVSSDRRTWAVWTDTRLGTDVTGRQDVELAIVDQPGTTPLVGQWPVLAVLLVLGLAALVAARPRPRGDAPPRWFGASPSASPLTR